MKNCPFNNLKELHDKIVEAGFDPNDEDVVVNISRTPLESIFPGKANYGDQAKEYDSFGFGPMVGTPWGPLPEIILLVRSDVIAKISGATPEKPKEAKKPKTSSLFPPGWKPAPGFTDPRV